jgi:hypothetical protein
MSLPPPEKEKKKEAVIALPTLYVPSVFWVMDISAIGEGWMQINLHRQYNSLSYNPIYYGSQSTMVFQWIHNAVFLRQSRQGGW